MMYLPKGAHLESFQIELARSYKRLINALMTVATSNETVHVYASDMRIGHSRIHSIQYIGGVWWLQSTNGCHATQLTPENAMNISIYANGTHTHNANYAQL